MSQSSPNEFGESVPGHLWECYGPADSGAVGSDARAVAHGLQSRADLNGQEVFIRGWDGRSGRFIVEPLTPGAEKIRVRAVNLRSALDAPDRATLWASEDAPFGALPAEVSVGVARYLGPVGLSDLSAGSRAVRSALCLQPESEAIWRELTLRTFGYELDAAVQVARPGVRGMALFRTVAALRVRFYDFIDIVSGSVATKGIGCDVVACPCLRNLDNAGFGAQGAIRRAGGPALERELDALPMPLGENATTLVTGGDLAKKVAMVVTEPPHDVFIAVQLMGFDRQGEQINGGPTVQERTNKFLEDVHENLMIEVRKANLRTVAMPTLCTGGMCMDPDIVAVGAIGVLHREFLAHVTDPIFVRICCFEHEHMKIFVKQKDEVSKVFLDRHPQWSTCRPHAIFAMG